MFYSFKMNYIKIGIFTFMGLLITVFCVNIYFSIPCADCQTIATVADIDTPSAERNVYLTFDDGPSTTTQAILDVLDAEKVPATFFVVADDNTLPYMNLVTRAHQGGHLIALHSATHNYKKIYYSTDAFWNDLEILKTELAKHIDVEPKCMRFPGGSTNTVSKKYGPPNIMKDLKIQALEKGYTYYDWNICVNDAVGHKKSSSEIVAAAIKVGKKNDCIILFHDSKQNKSTAQALPEIIKWYKDAGFTFKTVDQLVQ